MRTYTIVAEPEAGGGYFVTVPALPGCFTRAGTIEECRERAVEAIEVHIAVRKPTVNLFRKRLANRSC
jgi:antitoxin HicB